MDHTLEFVDISHSLVNLLLGVVSLAHSHIQLLTHAVASAYQGLSLLVKNCDSGVLGEALLLPLGQGPVVLIDGALLPLSELLVLSDRVFDIFVFSLDALVVHHFSVDVIIKVSDIRLLGRDLNPNCLDLLLYVHRLFCFVLVLLLKNVEFVFETVDDILLTLQLGLVIALQSSNAHIESLLSSPKLSDLLLQIIEISLVQFVGLNLSTVGRHDPLP